jgi:hypothetical protein
MTKPILSVVVGVAVAGCLGSGPEGVAPALPAATTVKMDFFHKPLPEIPLPNDVATRYEGTSATHRRVNASMVAPTLFERRTRELIDQLDGWGLFQPISIPFTGPLDVASIVKAHRDGDYDQSDDVAYLINIDRSSPERGRVHHLDLGNGNYPVVLERLDKYWKNDPRGWTLSLLFEEEEEDLNGNGRLDPGEDTDADGVLDRPNYLPPELLPDKQWPARDDLAGRADALMTFYERETNTLLLRTLLPLNERTTYAVVVTRRLKDANGEPVGSPYPYINHTSQTAALALLEEVLPPGLGMEDVAFAFSFTTQSAQSQIQAVRDGLYGHGVQAHLAQEFPAEVTLGKCKDPDPEYFPNLKNPYVLYQEQASDVLKAIAEQFSSGAVGAMTMDLVLEHQKYLDYYVVGSFESPQLFERTDADGEPLDLNLQSWPPDLDRVPAQARPETVHFWLSVPRKEVSARGEGKPAPVVIFGGGYTGSRVELIATAGFFARYGLAMMAMDYPSHGIGVSLVEEKLAVGVAEMYGIKPFVEAMLKGRSADMNGDGKKDSGTDYFTGYIFHTRDMLRQSALDFMQLVRILRSFDGQRRWKYDVNGKGQPSLAGDFDGDGAVDVGGDEPIRMAGGSLGGINTLLVGSLEPAIRTIAPISGGAGLLDVGIRSMHPGVPEAFLLRTMGPVYVGTLDDQTGETRLETIVPDLNDEATLHLATVSGVQAGDTMVVQNTANTKRGCGLVTAEGRVRASVESDLGDTMQISFYAGNVLEGGDCAVKQGAKPKLVVDTFKEDVVFQQKLYEANEPLVALAAGLGMRRATPGLRRFVAFGSMATDAGDPVTYLRHLQLEPLTYPGTGETTGAHALIITTLGDMSVPTSSGITAARAAGLIDYLGVDPRFGMSVNQKLIETHTAEGVHTLKRYTNAAGEGVHLDVENFSGGDDFWGQDLPRLSPPLRIGTDRKDRRGGVSAALFPVCDAQGSHFFNEPGKMVQKLRAECRKNCTETTGDDPCGCSSKTTFDDGLFLLNMVVRYLASGGTELSTDLCNSRDDCADKPEPPEERDKSTLP